MILTDKEVNALAFDTRYDGIVATTRAIEAAVIEKLGRKPMTKTRIGNELRRREYGDIGMYRNGFKDGVKFALGEKL